MYKGTEAMALTRKEWPKFCTAVIKVKENFESEDMSVREAIADSVSDYLLKQKDRICDRSDTETYLLAFSQQLPFSDGDDICICPDALRTYMKFNGKDDSIAAVRQGLIRMGFIKVCYVETISGYKYRHTYYRVNREDTSF